MVAERAQRSNPWESEDLASSATGIQTEFRVAERAQRSDLRLGSGSLGDFRYCNLRQFRACSPYSAGCTFVSLATMGLGQPLLL
jgi:hypothetical protein